jgi:diguanylate cyclase (GGDEF)-like protein/PAS domain S-box-containing protein
MKWYESAPAIPGLAIALAAMLLGGMVTAALIASMTVYAGRGPSLIFLLPSIVVTAVVFLLVVALVVLRARADRAYQTDKDFLDAFLEHVPGNVFFKDRNSRFIRINRATANYFGLSDPVLAVNKTDADIFSPQHASKAFADEQRIIRTGQPLIEMEEKETWPDGHEAWVLTSKMPLKNRQGRIVGTMGISRDITDRKRAELRIHYMALHDALTGLPNRSLLEDLLTQAIALACRNKKHVAVMMLDLDRFKYVNDSFGHHVGDQLLEEVSLRLRSALRESDIVARLGGDEFIICLPAIESLSDAELVSKKLIEKLVEPLQIEDHCIKIGASIGICEYPTHGENSHQLLQAADVAMYEAKKKGGGGFSFFVPELTDAMRLRQKLELELHHALARNEFVLYYQPLVSTVSDGITGVEALLRWRHPERGIIYPNAFVPQLEDLSLMVKVGYWVLKTACLQNAAWQKEGLPPVRMMVNLSDSQFYRGDIVSSVRSALAESGLAPQWLELELTELLMLDDSENTAKIMRELKQIGVSLSLDDFGTGWSSLSYLRRFPVDRIKIDRSFLRDMASEPAAEAVVKSILCLGRDLGLACVAEGVETSEQLAYFKKQRCAEVQGFFYSPAVPASTCRDLLRSGMTAAAAKPQQPVLVKV